MFYGRTCAIRYTSDVFLHQNRDGRYILYLSGNSVIIYERSAGVRVIIKDLIKARKLGYNVPDVLLEKLFAKLKEERESTRDSIRKKDMCSM